MTGNNIDVTEILRQAINLSLDINTNSKKLKKAVEMIAEVIINIGRESAVEFESEYVVVREYNTDFVLGVIILDNEWAEWSI